MKKSGRRQAEPDFFETIEAVPNFTTRLKFAGTDDPQCLRIIYALLDRPLSVEHEELASGSNAEPAPITKLRSLGLGEKGLPCTMVPSFDLDGLPVRHGVYHLTQGGSHAVRAWLRKRDKEAA